MNMLKNRTGLPVVCLYVINFFAGVIYLLHRGPSSKFYAEFQKRNIQCSNCVINNNANNIQ